MGSDGGGWGGGAEKSQSAVAPRDAQQPPAGRGGCTRQDRGAEGGRRGGGGGGGGGSVPTERAAVRRHVERSHLHRHHPPPSRAGSPPPPSLSWSLQLGGVFDCGNLYEDPLPQAKPQTSPSAAGGSIREGGALKPTRWSHRIDVTCHKTPPPSLPPPHFSGRKGSSGSGAPLFPEIFRGGGAGGPSSGGLSTRHLLSRSEAPGARGVPPPPACPNYSVRARTPPVPAEGPPGEGGGGASQRALSTLQALVRGRGAPWAEGRLGPE